VSPIVIGIDGGGSKTHAIVADESGAEISSVEGPGSAVRHGEIDQSAEVISALVADALASAGMSHVVPKVVCVGVAGGGQEHLRQALWQSLASRELAEDVVVHADATIAMDDAFGEGPGILLISGTGSVAFGRSPAGATARCGGWGPYFADEGSGHWIGRRALSVVAAAADGREPETALTGAMLTACEVDDVRGLVGWAAVATPALYATLAPAVIGVAEAGDLRANAILSMAVEELVLHVRALARQLFVDERAATPVALAGGLLRPRTTLRKRVEHRLKSAVPGAQVRAEPVIPARGAVRSALRMIGVEVRG
jgi:glucosamine kinase